MKFMEKKVVDVVGGLTCDKCGKLYRDPMDLQEFISIDHNCGYLSVIDDGAHVELDLCQNCWKNILAPIARITHY